MITIDENGLAEAQKLLADMPKTIPKAAARAINKTATATKTEAWKQVKKIYTIKRVRFNKAWDKVSRATASNLKAELISRSPRLPLSYFKIKPKSPPKRRPRNPVFVQVKRGEGGPIRDAFVARMKSGHTGVFHRMQDGSRGEIHEYKIRPRPKKRGQGMTKGIAQIEQNVGPAVPQMLGSKTVSAFIEKRASEVLNERFTHEVNAILNGVTK